LAPYSVLSSVANRIEMCFKRARVCDDEKE
jgi:hypothetical protein